jgi:LmbE family N-acetylglucosaminyl deacetylase
MAHQDDELRCLGTLLKCHARGDRLSFVTLTDGSKGFVQRPDIPREEAAAIRHQEMSRLAESLGADYINLREPDEFLYDTPEVRLRLIEAIRKTRAELVFTHPREDYNLDHTTTHALVMQCVMQAVLPVLPTASPPLPAHPAVFCVLPFGPYAFHPTHLVDVTAFEPQKLDLLRHHRSQDEAMRRSAGRGLADYALKADAYWGLVAECEYAEPFLPMAALGAVKPRAVLP